MPALISFTLKAIASPVMYVGPLTTAEVGLWARLGVALILTLYGLLGVSFSLRI